MTFTPVRALGQDQTRSGLAGWHFEGRGDSLLAIFATCYMRYNYSEWPMRYSDWFAACYMRYDEHLVCSVLSLTDTLRIYILTFTLQLFPSMERNLSKDAKHRLRLNNEARYSPTYLFPICFHNVVTQDLWDEYPFQVHVYNITTFLFVNFKSCQIMSSVSHANKIRECIATSIYYQCSVLDEILANTSPISVQS